MVYNRRPQAMKRLGLSYGAVSAANPRIIYAGLFGYGQDGPHADNPAHDHQIQAMAGLMDINGHPEGPPTRVGIYVSDLVTPLYSAFSILAALRHKEQTGEGQYLDASMMDTLASLMFMEPLEEFLADGHPPRAGNNARTGPTGLYHVKDADVIITVGHDHRYVALCEALKAPELATDERFIDAVKRAENLKVLRVELQDRFARFNCDEILARLKDRDVPVAPVRTLDKVLADPHFRDRGTLQPMRHSLVDEPVEDGITVGFPIKFSSGPLPQMRGAPTLGMDNEDVFGRLLNISAEKIQTLKDKGVV